MKTPRQLGQQGPLQETPWLPSNRAAQPLSVSSARVVLSRLSNHPLKTVDKTEAAQTARVNPPTAEDVPTSLPTELVGAPTPDAPTTTRMLRPLRFRGTGGSSREGPWEQPAWAKQKGVHRRRRPNSSVECANRCPVHPHANHRTSCLQNVSRRHIRFESSSVQQCLSKAPYHGRLQAKRHRLHSSNR